MKHKYFVSFVFHRSDGYGTETGSGNNVVECSFKIEEHADILEIQLHLEKDTEPPYDKVLITNFVHLGNEPEEEGEAVERVILN